MHDVFISYEHQSKTIADNIVNVLESNKIRCWYAPRDVIGDYATSICDAISNCKIFVLVLEERSSKSAHCLNEVEMAYVANTEGRNNIVIIPFRVDDKDLNRAMEYYVKRLHWIDATSHSIDFAIGELLEKISAVLGIETVKQAVSNTKDKRTMNKYDSTTEYELNRLQKQLNISKVFDQNIYDEITVNRKGLAVLDIGSNTGDQIMDRLSDKEEISLIVGLECNDAAVDFANKKYAGSKAKFYKCDVESEDFQNRLKEIMLENKVDSFDLINMSMVVLHMKNPIKVFKTLRKFLCTSGKIFIRDIDDGLNLAYPDSEGVFERIFEICSEIEATGYRFSGRQIPTYLLNSGFKNINLQKIGINTLNMDYDERQALFDTYFIFILEEAKARVDKYPTNIRINEDYQWIKNSFSDIEDSFHDPSFFFNLGFVLYTAEK